MISMEVKFNDLCAEAQSLGVNWKQLTESLPTIEAKVNALEAKMKESAVPKTDYERYMEAGLEATKPVVENAPVKKNNGAEMTFVEGDPLANQRSTSTTITEAEPVVAFAAVDKLIQEGIGFTPAQVAKVTGKYDVPDGLTEGQIQEWKFARSLGIAESDCTRLVKLTGGYNGRDSYGRL